MVCVSQKDKLGRVRSALPTYMFVEHDNMDNHDVHDAQNICHKIGHSSPHDAHVASTVVAIRNQMYGGARHDL